jgi:hypothetical protein
VGFSVVMEESLAGGNPEVIAVQPETLNIRAIAVEIEQE